jgi:hypothetical protein
LALIHHPNLARNETMDGLETPLSSSVQRSIKLSLQTSRQIADCLAYADLFDTASYCATPFINQCMFIAGVAFIHDVQMEEFFGEFPGLGAGAAGGGGGGSLGAIANAASAAAAGQAHPQQGGQAGNGRNIPMDFVNSLVKQNLSVIFKALRRMERYWGGLAYIIDVSLSAFWLFPGLYPRAMS